MDAIVEDIVVRDVIAAGLMGSCNTNETTIATKKNRRMVRSDEKLVDGCVVNV